MDRGNKVNYIIGKSGYLGRSLLDYFGKEAEGIGRSDLWPKFTDRDCIVNCTGYGWNPGQEDVGEAIDTNINLTVSLERARNGANYVFFASGMQRERPEHLYSLTKNVACRYLEGKAHILILYTIYGGKWDPPWRFMGTFLRAAKFGKPYVITTPHTTRDFVYIDRLCNTVADLSFDRRYRTIDFGCGKARSLMDVYNHVMLNFPDACLDYVKFQYPKTKPKTYCAERPHLPDYFNEDMEKTWGLICE